MIYLLILEGRGEREGEREGNIDWMTIICTMTRDRMHNLGKCPDQEGMLFPSPEPHRPGGFHCWWVLSHICKSLPSFHSHEEAQN